jgi:cation transport ATPase
MEHLRKKGWSEAEITQVSAAFVKAAARNPFSLAMNRLYLVVLVLLLLLGAACMAAFLSPVILFTPFGVSAVVTLLAGGILGWSYTAVLHTLRSDTNHHHIATGVMVIFAYAIVVWILTLAQARYAIIPGVVAYNPWMVAFLFIVGVTLPYFDRRLHGPR